MARRRPSRPVTPEQKYLDAILGELRGINAKLDGQATVSARSASGQSEKVRLEEPVRPDSEPAAVPDIDPDFPDSGRAENAPEGTCQEQTRRGNTCGKPLPCRYHG